MEVSRAKGNLLMIVPAVFNEKEMKIGDGGLVVVMMIVVVKEDNKAKVQSFDNCTGHVQ